MNASSITEQWRDVVGYEGRYQVSDQGRVRSLDRTVEHTDGLVTRRKGVMLKPHWHNYARVAIEQKTHNVARVVLDAFIGLAPEGHEAAHNNGDTRDNRLSNLRWSTRKDNHADKRTHGTLLKGEQIQGAKLDASKVRRIKQRLMAGDRSPDIAADYGVHRVTIVDIKLGRTWKHIDGAAEDTT